MSDPLSQSIAFRLLLAFLEEDTPGSIDSVSRILTEEVDGDAALDIIMLLVSWLVHEIDHGKNRDAWLAFIRFRLVGSVGGVPDIVPDFDATEP